NLLDAQWQLVSAIRSRPVLASPFGFIDAQQELVFQLKRRVREIFDFRLQSGSLEVSQLKARARSLSPQLTLERGYAVLTDPAGNRVATLAAGQEFVVKTSNQEISAQATKVKEL
ncbi:MAG: hypothetical protein RL696_630, partial [Actinomycetota bacterium]